jgi:hypothetical protein
MDNQHRKISGYRELSQEDIDLMNRIKQLEKEALILRSAIQLRIKDQVDACGILSSPAEQAEHDRLIMAEPLVWADQGIRNIQTGVMQMVRAVAQPS